MPSKSSKQARTMRAASHDSQFAKKMSIPQHVARDFVEADKRRRSVKKRIKAKAKAKKSHTFMNH